MIARILRQRQRTVPPNDEPGYVMGEIPSELMQELQRISFVARRQATEGMFGRYRSAFKGQGIEFEELRAYTPGDDIRAIHWPATARSQVPQVKRFREERELSVVLAIDVSLSHRAGTGSCSRAHYLARLGATLACIALKNNDKIGLVTFSSTIETFSPPRKDRASVWRIIHEILYPNSEHQRGTSIASACEFLTSVLKRRTIVFILSDFIDADFEQSLAILAQRHDVSAFVIQDPSESILPNIGLVRLEDPESGAQLLLDTADTTQTAAYLSTNAAFRQKQQELFRRLRIPQVTLKTNEDFQQPLRRFFDAKGAARLARGV